VVLLMLAPAGMWAASKCGHREALLMLLLYASLYSGANILFFVCDRFRYPVWPALAALAGGGWAILYDAVRGGRIRTCANLLAVMALMAMISLPNWFGAKLPSFARDYFFRSIAWYEKERYPEALADIARSLALDPRDVNALQHRGNVLMGSNRIAEARAAYEAALKISPNDSGIWNNYGVTLEALGRTNEALQAFDRAVAALPPSKNAFLQIAFLQIRLNHPGQAAGILDQLQILEPEPDAVALTLRSVLARKRGETGQAAELERLARKLDPAAAEWALRALP
jgi:tetratricopeptide (TPR) repeat protein